MIYTTPPNTLAPLYETLYGKPARPPRPESLKKFAKAPKAMGFGRPAQSQAASPDNLDTRRDQRFR